MKAGHLELDIARPMDFSTIQVKLAASSLSQIRQMPAPDEVRVSCPRLFAPTTSHYVHSKVPTPVATPLLFPCSLPLSPSSSPPKKRARPVPTALVTQRNEERTGRIKREIRPQPRRSSCIPRASPNCSSLRRRRTLWQRNSSNSTRTSGRSCARSSTTGSLALSTSLLVRLFAHQA